MNNQHLRLFATCAALALVPHVGHAVTNPPGLPFPADGDACKQAADACLGQPRSALDPYCAYLGNNSTAVGGWCDGGRELGGSIHVLCEGNPQISMECRWGDGGININEDRTEKTTPPLPGPGPISR